MNIAKGASKLSHCTRSKVGAVIVKDGNIISWGYNGTPEGFDNCCEDKEFMDPDAPAWRGEDILNEYPLIDDSPHTLGQRYRLKTKAHVLHAEMNAILKLAASHENSQGASLFCTYSPCEQCAILIIKARIKEVYYSTVYRSTVGIDLLTQAGIKVHKVISS